MGNGKKQKKGSNGRAVATRRDTRVSSKPSSSRSLTRRLFNNIARLLTWVAIINIIFRCPSSLDQCDEESPLFCKQYFQAKDVLTPVVKPHYDAHAAPYIDLVKPYYGMVDRAILTPAHAYGVKYAMPRVEQAQAFSKVQWDRQVQPQVERARAIVLDRYNEQVAPHVEAATNAASPYYDIARTSALQTYHELIMPAYIFAEPHAINAYKAARSFTVNTAVPSAIWAMDKTYVFLDGAVLPRVRTLYAEAVEPQLVRIGQRLGRYNGTSKSKYQVPESVTASATSSFARPAPLSASSTSSAAPASVSTVTATKPKSASRSQSSASASSKSTKTTSMSDDSADLLQETQGARPDLLVHPPPVESNESDKRRETRIELGKDLIMWQDKFMDAAEVGAKEIAEKVVEICTRMESQEVEVNGKDIVDTFVHYLDKEMVSLRVEIMNIVETVSDESEALSQVAVAVKNAGVNLKEMAQEIRSWREEFETELHLAINRAAHAHFALIDNIRDLATQKMGMKWAWMDEVTYKDWKLYHRLKDEFSRWRNDLERDVVTHKSLTKATAAAADVEDLGMTYAKDAAIELKRLKEVGHWKVIAGDASTNFDSAQMRLAAEAAQAAQATGEPMTKKASKQAADDVVAATEVKNPDSCSTSLALKDSSTPIEVEASFDIHVEHDDGNMADEYDAEAEDRLVVGVNEANDTVESAASTVNQVVESIKSGSMNMKEEMPTIVANETDATSSPEPAEAKQGQGEETEEPQSPAESVTVEKLKEQMDSSDEQSPAEVDIETEALSSDEDQGTEVETEVDAEEEQKVSIVLPEAASRSVKPAMFGAAAQVVPRRKGPILDVEEEDDIAAQISAMALRAYSTATSVANMQYSIAMGVVSSQIGAVETNKPFHDKMASSVSSAYSNAMASASSRMDEAVSAASAHGVFPTANPLADKWSSVEQVASSRLVEGRAWAAANFESARIAVGMASPTATNNVDKLMGQAKYHYYAGLGMAQARYEEFLDSAASALSSVTATPAPTDLQGTVSSIASVVTESAVSAASVASKSASSAVSAASDSAESAASVASGSVELVASVAGDSASFAASVAGEKASSVVSMVGEGASQAYSAASSNVSSAGNTLAETFDEAVSRLSMQVYGEPTPTAWYDQLLSSATAVVDVASSAAEATASVQVKWDEVNALVSELVVGKEPTFTESVFSRLGEAYGRATSVAESVVSGATDSVSSMVSEAAESVVKAKDEL